MAKKKVFTDESLQTFVEEIKSYTDDSVSNVSTVEVSETEPTNESVDLWINPTDEDTINVPEVNDETTNSVDTWSSMKINNEINVLKELVENLSASSSITVADDDNGNVTISTTGSMTVSDDDDGNVTIGG